MIRGAVKELDYELLVDDDHNAAPTVTTIVTAHLNTERLIHFLREQFGLIIAGGLGVLKGKIIRIGHMGYCSPAEMLQIISLLELGFKQFDSQIELGRGISKAQEIYYNHLMIE